MKLLPFLLCFLFIAISAYAQNKSWVFFTHKSASECQIPDSSECLIAPIDTVHLIQLEAYGATVKTQSRWFNAVSVEASDSVLAQLAALSFIQNIKPVRSLSRKKTLAQGFPEIHTRHHIPMSLTVDPRIYGKAWEHISFHKIDKVHELGYFGNGVKVGVIDGGFDLGHPAFTHLHETGRILGERDFVHGGDDTKANVINPDYVNHGTATAGMISGRIDGDFFGVAPGISLAVARTEDDRQEALVEEDHWVEAIEWLQTLGVQVVSSSLGYNIFTTNPEDSHSYEDMDGKSTVISRAASMATRIFNMVVVNSAGNEGAINNPWRYITAPADADSILAVGSVTASGNRASSSSIGPTYDGRIKPDVSARGACVASTVSLPNPGINSCLNGTSFAAPLVAGIVALAIEAKPGKDAYWYVQKVKLASSQADNPDNLLGYGIVDAYKLIQDLSVSTQLSEDYPDLPDKFLQVSNYPNPFNPQTTLTYKADQGWLLNSVHIVDVTGRLIAQWSPSQPNSTGSWEWNGTTLYGNKAASGVYLAMFRFSNGSTQVIKPHTMSLIK